MENEIYWKLFEKLGSVDSYLLMREAEQLTEKRKHHAADQHDGIDFKSE